ncbi:MAG TPA: hypothetical protein VGO60_14245 [Iamia sp.]|nr:hypothetical protein [Iamia sp.]
MRDPVRTALVVAALVVVAACGEDERVQGADEPTPPSLPAEVEAMWAVDDPEVAVGPPASSWLPGEDGGQLTRVRAAEPDAFAWFESDAAAQTLYLDPDAADPATGRALLVGRVDSSDSDGALHVAGGEPVDVRDVEGEVVEAGGLVVVRWPNPDIGDDCACAQDLFVAGRGVDRAEVLAAAEVAEPLAPLPSLPADTVEGLRSLGTSPGVLGRDLAGRTASQVLEMRQDDIDMTVAVVASDPRLVAHLGFWAPDGIAVSRWDQPMVADLLDEGTVAVATTTRFGAGLDEPLDLDGAVSAAGDALATLVPATEDDVVEAQERILTGVPLEPCATAAAEQVDMAGTVGATRWTVGVSYVDGVLNTCEASADVDGASDPGGGSGGAQPLDLTVPAEVVGGVTSNQGEGGRWLRFAIGHVTAAAATVEVTVPGSPPVVAVVADTGPAPDRRWFAAVVELTALDADSVATVVVRDAAGAEIGRTGP